MKIKPQEPTTMLAEVGDVVSINDGEYYCEVVEDYEWDECKNYIDFKENHISISEVGECDYEVIKKGYRDSKSNDCFYLSNDEALLRKHRESLDIAKERVESLEDQLKESKREYDDCVKLIRQIEERIEYER